MPSAAAHLDNVSGDRIRNELQKQLEEANPAAGLIRAVELGLLAGVQADLTRTDVLERWREVGAESSGEAGTGPLSWLAALAYPLTAGAGDALARRLNLPVDWARVAFGAIELRANEPEVAAESLLPSGLCRLVEPYSLEAVRLVAGISDSPRVAARLLEYLNHLRHVEPTLRGQDLLRMGMPPGPQVGETLARIKELRLNGQLVSSAGERRWAKEQVRRLQQGVPAQRP